MCDCTRVVGMNWVVNLNVWSLWKIVEGSISKEFEKVVSTWSHGVLVCLKAVKLAKTKSEKPLTGSFFGSTFSLKHSTSSNLVIQISLVLIFFGFRRPLLASWKHHWGRVQYVGERIKWFFQIQKAPGVKVDMTWHRGFNSKRWSLRQIRVD